MYKQNSSRWPIAGAIFLLGIILGIGSASAILVDWIFILLATGVLMSAAYSTHPLIVAGAILLSAAILVLSPVKLTALTMLPALGGGILVPRVRRTC